MTDGPKRIPEDERAALHSVPVIGNFTQVDFTEAEVRLSEQIEKLHETVALLQFVETQPGAAFVLGEARGRLNTLLSLGMINRRTYLAEKTAIKAKFDARWPGLRVSDYFSEDN